MQCISNVTDLVFNDELLSGTDLLQSLFGTIFHFQEHQISLSADIGEIFLQIAVPSDGSRCLRLFWREEPEQNGISRVRTTRFWGEKVAKLCKIYFALSGGR